MLAPPGFAQAPTSTCRAPTTARTPRPHLDRFVAAYRRAGGVVDLELFQGEGQGFIMRKVGSPNSNRALEMIIEFTH
jgi:acetyl esterase